MGERLDERYLGKRVSRWLRRVVLFLSTGTHVDCSLRYTGTHVCCSLRYIAAEERGFGGGWNDWYPGKRVSRWLQRIVFFPLT